VSRSARQISGRGSGDTRGRHPRLFGSPRLAFSLLRVRAMRVRKIYMVTGLSSGVRLAGEVAHAVNRVVESSRRSVAEDSA
jgi:hypothetical protein